MHCLNENNKHLTFIDLFAGAGGLSEGFVACGFTPIAHVEMNSHACDTLKTRACFYWLKEHNQQHVYYDYLSRAISRDRLYKTVPPEILDSVICKEMCNDTMPGIFKQIDCSLEKLGFLQRTSTAKKLSKSVRFYEEKAKVNKKIKLAEIVGSPVTLLSQYKTHMESSIYYMSPITSSKKSILDCWLDDSRIDSLMLIGQANYEGKIQNIGPGQLKGMRWRDAVAFLLKGGFHYGSQGRKREN